jgi:hypothetical protein
MSHEIYNVDCNTGWTCDSRNRVPILETESRLKTNLMRRKTNCVRTENNLTFDSLFGRRKARKGCALSTRKADSLIALFVRENEGTAKRF